jgi:hypothetical protein
MAAKEDFLGSPFGEKKSVIFIKTRLVKMLKPEKNGLIFNNMRKTVKKNSGNSSHFFLDRIITYI